MTSIYAYMLIPYRTQTVRALSDVLWLGICAVIRMLQLHHSPIIELPPLHDHFWNGCINLGFSHEETLLSYRVHAGRSTYKR